MVSGEEQAVEPLNCCLTFVSMTTKDYTLCSNPSLLFSTTGFKCAQTNSGNNLDKRNENLTFCLLLSENLSDRSWQQIQYFMLTLLSLFQFTNGELEIRIYN